MEKRVYISETERERCRRVADAYSELYENEDLLVMDAGRYGFVMVQYYAEQRGFDNVYTFTDSRELFEDLWKEWLYSELIMLAKDTPMIELDYGDIFKCLPKEKQKELMDRRMSFAQKAGQSEYGTETDETWWVKGNGDD